MTQSLLNRIERAEDAAKAKSKFVAECVCFPEREQPSFNWPIEQKIAAQVRCPLHGERFKPLTYFVYVAKWLREKRPYLLETHHSEQYRRAWYASFPAECWPGKEVLLNGILALELKNGSTLPVE